MNGNFHHDECVISLEICGSSSAEMWKQLSDDDEEEHFVVTLTKFSAVLH